MNSSTTYRLIIFALICAALTSAQTTNGRTDMYYDSGTNTIYAVTSLSADYNTQYYYAIEMTTSINKLGLSQGYGYWTTEWGSGGAVATTSAAAGYEYTAVAYYYGIIRYQVLDVIYPCTFCNAWYDAHGYQSLIGQGGPVSDGPTFSVWVWAAPSIVGTVLSQTFPLGDGGAKRRAPGTVRPDFDVAFRNFIPARWVDGPDPFCLFPFDGHSIIYNGNGRGFTRNTILEVKTHSNVVLLPDIGSYTAPYKYTGVTERYDKATGLAADGQTLLRDSVFNDCYKLDDGEQAPVSEFNIGVTGSTGTASAHFYGDAKNPMTIQFLTPGITWDSYVTVSKATPQSQATFTATGIHDCFPAFEVYIGAQRVHEWTPSSHAISNIAACLSGFGQRTFNNSGQVN